MAARTVPELATRDGQPDKKRQNSTKRRSSTNLSRDPYHEPVGNEAVEILKSPSKLSDKRRAEHPSLRSNLRRDSLTNTHSSARISSRVDTTPSTSHHHTRTFISHTTPSSALITSSKSTTHLSPNPFVHSSRLHHTRPTSSRALSRPASTIQSEVIDLTLEDDTEDERPLIVLARKRANFRNLDADPRTSRQNLPNSRSSPIGQESLFTPPPPSRRRARVVVDYLAVPSFPKGLTKADYVPMFHHPAASFPGHTVTSTVEDSSPTETLWHTPQKRKGKERELDVASCKKPKRRSPTHEIDVDPNALLDAFYKPIMVPIHDDDTYPPLTPLDLVTNTRFQFAHAWRGQVSKLREAELNWMFNFPLLGKVCVWAQSVKTSSPRVPGTAGFVSCEQLRPWESVPPEGLPEEKSSNHVLQEQTQGAGSHGVLAVDADRLLLSGDPLSGPSAASNPASSSSTAAPVVDMEHGMGQYFNGLDDSPAKHASPRRQLGPTHTFRLHLSQLPKHAQSNLPESGFPSLEPDPRLTDTGDHECFLGIPPSPPPADLVSSTVAEPIPHSPFETTNYFPASPSNILGTSHTDAWSLEQEESPLQDNDSSANNHVSPIAPGTIDPSLLGPEESQKPSPAPKESVPKRRHKLPEPVVYIRRPVDSSSLPLRSGKRSVQIKYRDSAGSPTSSLTQTRSNSAPSNPVENPIEQLSNEAEDSPQPRRRSVPSRKFREYHPACDSDSDYLPERPASKIKIKIKRPSLKDKESFVEHGSAGTETAPAMTFCHQCRNTSLRPKMLCSNTVRDRICGKRFCNRCILYRYPDVTFDEHSPGFLCPVCTNTCNCSACSRKRGEEFVSMRLGGLAASLFKTKVTFVRDIGKPLNRAPSPSRSVDTRRSVSAVTTPTPEPGALPAQPRFWAHVYGMEGERMGSAFMSREQLGLQAHEVSPLPAPPKQLPRKARKSTERDKERETTRGPRVFIGRPLPSWRVRAVRDLEPSIDVESRGKGKGKGKETGTGTGTGMSNAVGRRRWYIGDPAPLHEPYGRMPGSTSLTPSSRSATPAHRSDGSLTPLSELDDWPQPGVGEVCSWAPPPPPGTVVHSLSSDSSGPFAMAAPPESSVEELLGLGSSFSSGVNMNMDFGNEHSSSSTALTEEDVARAIGAALAAISVEPPA